MKSSQTLLLVVAASLCCLTKAARSIHHNKGGGLGQQKLKSFEGTLLEEIVANSTNTFAFKVFKELTVSSPGNLIFCPPSLHALLSLVHEGAQGETAQQLGNALGLPARVPGWRRFYMQLQQLLTINSTDSELDMANALFADGSSRIKSAYSSTLQQRYHTAAIQVDFTDPVSAAGTINKWASDETRNRITELFAPGDLDEKDLLVLASAMFFRGKWLLPFDRSDTTDEMFTGADGEKGLVPMMYQQDEFRILEADDFNCQVLQVPFAGDKQVMLVFLPLAGGSVQSLLEALQPEALTRIIRTLEETEPSSVQVLLPRFMIKSDLALVETLMAIGITDVFTRNADLSKLTDAAVYLSKVVQKAEMDVDEEGATASAASGGTVTMYSLGTSFNANRPFIFLVVDSSTGTILFAGRLSQPQPKEAAQ